MEDFNKIYNAYYKDIYRYLYYLTSSHHRAEELLQETFFQAFKSIEKFKGRSKVSTWLYGIAKNLYFKDVRESKKFQQYPLEEKHIDNTKCQQPDEILEQRENHKNIIQEINSLEDSQRQVVILRVFNELSFREIGDILDKNENWARVTFYRSKVKIHEALREGGNDNEY